MTKQSLTAGEVVELANLIAALEFYAERRHYKSRRVNDGDGHFDHFPSNVEDDEGEIARQALGTIEQERKAT